MILLSGLVPALLGQQCDMIVDQLFYKPERQQVINIVNYTYSSQSVVVLDQVELIEQGPPEQILSHPNHPRTRPFLSRVYDPSKEIRHAFI